ncbi:MAG: hypothetical protein F6K26_00655 [Moorea sp. SIO2I5]|nr:hypothetical protein [Moorena sp. SIO2I5]
MVIPCSLFPVPCSLFPVPCSLFPLINLDIPKSMLNILSVNQLKYIYCLPFSFD